MKKAAFILLIFRFSIVLYCQEWQYSSVINGTGIEPKYSTTDQQGNVYILSQFLGTLSNPSISSYGFTDLFLCKMSSTGVLQWYDQIGNTAGDLPGGLTIHDGFLYVSGAYNAACKFNSGAFQIENTGNTDIFLAKYSLNGEFQYAKRVGSYPSAQACIHIKADNENHLIMTGYMKDSVLIGNNSSDQVAIKGTPNIISNFIASLDLEGNCIWAKPYKGNNTATRFQRIGISENGYYFGGYYMGELQFDIDTITSYSATKYDAFIYKTDFNGNGLWVRRIRGDQTENFRTLTTDEYDNLYVLGNYYSNTLYIDETEAIVKTHVGNNGDYDIYLAKYNRDGVLQWFLTRGGPKEDIYNDFVVSNNVIYTTGYFADSIIFNNDTLRTDNPLNEDAFVAAFNQIGDPISGISIKGTGNYRDAGSIVRMDANSRAYVAGYFKSPQIQIGNQIYTSGDVNVSDQFFAIYKQPFKAVITSEKMVSCHGSDDGMLTVTPYFGRPPFTYSWSHNPSLNSAVAENLPAGNYTVTVTDANSSVTSITGEITQAASLTINGSITPVKCIGDENGKIDLTVTGGTGVYNYYWTTLNGSGVDPIAQNQDELSAGTYNVVVTDANLCSDTTDFLVSEPLPFDYSETEIISIIKPILPTGRYGEINLEVTGGNAPYTSFNWTYPDATTASSPDIANLDTSGLYVLHLVDSQGCVSDTSFLVIDNRTFVAEIISSTNETCADENDGTAKVRVHNGSAPYSFAWIDGITTEDSLRTGMSPKYYTVTVTDGTGKKATAAVTITGPAMSLTAVLNPHPLTCNGDQSGVMDLTVTGGTLPYTYSWDYNNYHGEDLVNVPANVYTVTVTDGSNCVTQASAEVTQPAVIGITVSIQEAILCHGENNAIVSATASGGSSPGVYDYLWDDPGAQITPIAYDLSAGTYHIKVTDPNGCYKTTEITVLEPDTLAIVSDITEPSCPGMKDGSIIPAITGGKVPYEYAWSNNIFTRQNTSLEAGIYVLKVTDNNLCEVTDTVELTDPASIVISTIDSIDVSCLGKTDGAITINATGGTGVLQYSTDNGTHFSPSASFNQLSAGEYQVMVKDANSCSTPVYPVSITILDTVLLNDVLVTDALCRGLDNGSITITAEGGSGNYEYSIDGGDGFSQSNLFELLAAGNYEVIARDNNDCASEIENRVILYTDTIKAAITTEDASCDGIADGALIISARGGSSTFEYSNNGGVSYVTDSAFLSLANGVYAVLVKNGSCLSEEYSVTVNAPDFCGLIIYDAITPDNNSKNDVWNIGNVLNYPNIKVKIVNIWGKTVFSSSGYGSPWDGTFEGKELPAGTYYYIIDPGDGSDVLNGPVNIVK